MADVEITSIFREIIENNFLYCGICLRTERERKLVEPVYYRKCITLLPVRTPDHAALRTCVVCEAHARRAYQLYSAASFAAVVNRWFQAMSTKLRYIEDMSADLKRITEHSRFEELPLSPYWQLLRSRTELLQTEILRVCSEGIERQREGDVDTIEYLRPTPTPTPTPTAAKPTRVTSPVPHAHSETFSENDMLGDPDLERVVIIEDEDEIQTSSNVNAQTVSQSLPTLVPMTTVLTQANVNNIAILPNEPLLMSRDVTSHNSFVLHPAHVLPDGNYYIPSLNAVTNNAVLLPAPEIYANYLPPLDRKYENVKYVEIDGKNYNITLADIYNSEVKYNQLVSVNNPIVSVNSPLINVNSPIVNVNSPPVIVNSDSVISGVQYVPIKPKPGKRQCAPICVQADDSPSITSSKNVKQAVMSTRVDWEDKIPMDVISFMDATDPNAEQLLGSTVEDNSQSRLPKKSRNKPVADVIDLC